MRRQFLFSILIAVFSVGLASCVDEPAEQDSGSTTRLGLDESISCPQGEVGWRFPKTPLDRSSEEYASRAGESATVEITERYAVDVQSATCAGSPSAEVNALRNECAGSLTCRYSPSCSGSFSVTYTCGAGDNDENGEQKVYTAQSNGGGPIDLACSQPADEAVEVETRTACIPRQCHGRARRDLNMECVENPSAIDVAMRGDFARRRFNGASREIAEISTTYEPQTQRNINVLQGRPIDRAWHEMNPADKLGRFGIGAFPIYPGMSYSVPMWLEFFYGIVPSTSSVVGWMTDIYTNNETGERVHGFRCVAFKKDIVPDEANTISEDGSPKVIGVEFSGVFSDACTDGRAVSEDNAAKRLGLSVGEFRRQYTYTTAHLRASYDMEGHAAWHKPEFNWQAQDPQYLAYNTPECVPNPQDFYYDADSGTYDLIGYYAQREFAKPVPINFVGPEVGRRALILPGDIDSASQLTVRLKSQFNTSLPIDLSWRVLNLNHENPYNPWAKGVDIGGAWEDGKSQPEANYAPTNVHASVFLYPWNRTTTTTALYRFKLGEIPLKEPRPEGKTDSVNLPITEKIKRYFTDPNSYAYIPGDSRMFRLFYCIESDEHPRRSHYVFKSRRGTYYYGRDAYELQQNYTISDYFPEPHSHAYDDPEYYFTAYSLVLDTIADARAFRRPFGRTMRGCRPADRPLYVNLDRFSTPMEPIATTGFTGSTKTSQTGDRKMSGSNDNDTEVNCTGQAKDNCVQVDNGGNRTDGEGGRSTFDLNGRLGRDPGNEASAGMTAEMLGYQLVDPADPVTDAIDFPADSAGASSTPVKITLAPDWDGIRAALERASTGSSTEWDTGRYGGQMGLGVGWGFKYRWQIGPAPVLISFTFTVGASVAVEAQLQFGPTDEQKYPCIGTQSCIVKVSEPAGFRDAARTCNVKGGRLAELSSQSEANSVDANRGAEDVWLGAQLAYRYPKPACATNFNASECTSRSKTEYRWLSNSAAFASNSAEYAPTYHSSYLFNAFESGLSTRYPHDSAVVYRSDGTLDAVDVNVQKPYLCVFEPVDRERFLRWQLALKMGAAAGFNLQGCTPSDNPGFCLGAGFNVVSLSVGPVYENIYHWLYRAGEDAPFSKRGNTNISVPWALKLFTGAVTASVNFLWFSSSWNLVTYDGITAAEGTLYDADTPTFESLE